MQSPNDKLEFMQSRDLGQVFNSTFRFIRQNRRILFRTITTLAMPFSLTAIGFYLFGMYLIFKAEEDLKFILFGYLNIGIGALIFFIGSLFFTSSIFEYINLYRDAEDYTKIRVKDVWASVRKNFWKWVANILVWGALSGVFFSAAYVIMIIFVAIGAGLMAAMSNVAPLIIFMVLGYLAFFFVIAYVQSIGVPIFFISSYEKKDVFPAIGKAFQLMHSKGNFWKGLWTTFVGNLVQYILTYALTVPVTIVLGVVAFNISQTYGTDFSGSESTIILIVVSVFTPLYYIALEYSMAIYLISQAFKTGDLNERHYGSNILARIQKMGTYSDLGPEHYTKSY